MSRQPVNWGLAGNEPEDDVVSLRARVQQLEVINAALIDRIERASSFEGNAFSMFETAISLEALVRDRTAALESALDQLSRANSSLALAHRVAEEARTRLRDAIESLSDGFAIYDGNDRLVVCNAAFRRLWPEIAELSDDLQFSELARAVAERGRTIGSLVSPDRWVADRMARHTLARGIHIQALSDGRWFQINEMRTSEGGVVGIYTDITEVKAAEARQHARHLGEHNLALQSTLDTLSEGVCLYDHKHGLQVYNGGLARLLGLREDHRPIATHAGLVEHCRALGLDEPGILDWRAAPGERQSRTCRLGARVVEIRSTPIEPGGMAYSFDDVTDRQLYEKTLREAAETLERRVTERTRELEAEVAERRAVEAQLMSAKTAAEHANRSKTSFLAAASHDLLQPLNAARLFVAALSERRLALPTRALVRQTGVALDSVEELLEALFEISRLDAGAVKPEVTTIELDRMLGALRIEFATQAKQAGLILRIPDTGLWVRSDIRMLRRILQNFLSNALRYTREGEVSIDVMCEDGEARIAVCDSGPGIQPQHLTTIFEEFRRVNPDRSTPGNGLGLAIVQRASQTLGHRIEVTSTPGVGSQFAVRVPIGEPVREAPPLSRSRERAEVAGQTGSIVIIDNDPSILRGMEALLERWSYRVITAHSLEALMERVEGGSVPGWPPALIIADYHLDDGKLGDDIIAELRARIGAPVPALIISADRSEEVKGRIQQAALPMLQKPVKPAQLRALIRTLLS
ncbi:signal transduction histidine kinase [Novosphingobium nitrogenifigens DSM 19370]|uniref:histidine kinase n=1 Tax=Novosphingobium nitrogenifigens DSM 19370 TaxID=983920 RepID=F1ZB89_9SPHN|nr:NahK/ErcS family hybrid sensor histidine kinase/response regulator [Novosphingobium nitrogenifigens]EGD58213.1 signal transduction histidine kinase [Novosphingobium nitrogenifigens DSM 19370]